MNVQVALRGLAVVVLAFTAVVSARPKPALAAMCASTGTQASSCATCCYGDGAEECCANAGCHQYCDLSTSFCCPGGYQVNICL